ncbi:MAG: tryptophan-rich sensory protein [Acidaminococcaceae bacterium]
MLNRKDISIPIEIITAATFLLMVITNILANFLPINGITTGQVLDFYPNLFAPVAATFAIWGLIYMLLAGYVFYQLGLFQSKINIAEEAFSNKIRVAFIISSFANSLWLVAWHNLQIVLSMFFIIIIFLCLGYIFHITSKYSFSFDKRIFVKIPFSVYFAWITVAMIANFAVLAVSRQWHNLFFAESTWTIMLILFGLILGAFIAYRYKDAVYGAVLIWAYSGILIKHMSVNEFNRQYPMIIVTLIGSLALLILPVLYILLTNKKKYTD